MAHSGDHPPRGGDRGGGVLGRAAAEALLAWGVPRLRDLPWRATRDPWAILVSEVMLQQTSVGRVLQRWPRFVERFPTPPACTAATLGDVLREWQGMGYPRRARDLHATATVVTERAAGRLPATLPELLALPGIGPYTARAVLSFAFEADAAVVDVNIARVLHRLAGRRSTPAELQRAADAALVQGEAWAWNQTLMDLGATVCTARRPACTDCPLRPACRWRGDERVADPAQSERRQARFEGSDRQARGRLLRAAGDAPIAVADLAVAGGLAHDPQRARTLADTLVADGLLVRSGARYRLP